jgi:DNA-binding LacI/PurR family transcriptional regulator
MIIDRNSPVPQYFQLQTWLREQIEQGVFKPDDKIPTEEELVQITGLARATIRQATTNLVNMGYLTRKRRLGTFVTIQTDSSRQKDIIGVLVPDIRAGYAPELARGVEDGAANNKLSTILCNTDDLFVKADFHADRLIENSVCGVVFVPTAAADDKNRQIVEKFRKRNIPVVLADRIIPDIDVDYVTTDNLDGAYKLTKYLLEKGHRKIGITLSTLFSTERLRFEGYKKALNDNHIPFDPGVVFLHNGPYTEKHYLQTAKAMLDNRRKLTAIFAGHDRIAYLIYSVALKYRMTIPEDLSLVGYDDLHPTCSHLIPLTTMHQPIYEMGQESLKILVSRIRGEMASTQQIVLRSHLVERTSAAPLKTF